MPKKYRTRVNDEHSFDFDEKEIDDLDLSRLGENDYHILEKHRSVTARLEKSDFPRKTYTVSINNNPYEVSIFNDLDLQIEGLGFSLSQAAEVTEIKAPMPGMLLEMYVKPGDSVEEDQPLLVLEAMKMENVIVSPRTGTIATVTGKKGKSVDKGSILITFE
ncbi:acetyl-CoA carboxylase biotin carboxyl carrier protein subunit [Robertkochia aurantiaca]|uniref:acetyl-CoA carboxylase biotin carboxyl carrier protein subunit n=1 Tax=Robertkochia aurantiaca TaxID=2873700 RepID=UPI001CC9C067|nr:acetyl-CoA carboxylase biotin carboxyl carrier protein subunit [Robertkochia sp. 3YJGBD-33]